MNKIAYNLTDQLNSVFSKNERANLFSIIGAGEFFLNLSKNLLNEKVEVAILEKDFNLFGKKIFTPLKQSGVNLNYFLVESENLSKKLEFDALCGVIIAVGSDKLIQKAKEYALTNGKKCYLVPTTPYIENLFVGANNNSNLFAVIDLEIIEKASSEYYAEAYMSVMNKLTLLIDYKINSFVSGESIDGLTFERVKSAINEMAVLPKYVNYKTAILGAQLSLLILNAKSDALQGLGAGVLVKALEIVAPNVKGSTIESIVFEKTAKIYHMYFSNDFSSLLSVADYNSDIELLSSLTGESAFVYYQNLKIPSEKRRTLINLLINKISKDVKSETTAIMAISKNVLKMYNNIYNVERETISYKQIKTAVQVASYLTPKTSVLSLCRDGGILKCLN